VPRKRRKTPKTITKPGDVGAAPPPAPDAVFIDAAQLLSRYGGRSFMWLERLLARDATFPRPVKIARLRFWRLDELVAWERETAANSRAA